MEKKQAKGDGVVQPGEKKALGTPYSGLQVPKMRWQENWRGTLPGSVAIGQRVMALNWRA